MRDPFSNQIKGKPWLRSEVKKRRYVGHWEKYST
jgi:hypothetical protein